MIGALRIGVVRYVNFGPFADATFDFSRPGLTGVEGRILWKPGCDDNGSGKSFVLEGPAWCLWGSCLRPDYKGDAIIRTLSTGGAFVEVNVLGAEVPISVVRYRGHPKYKNRVYLFVDGEDITRGTDVETQAAIDHLLGMDFTAFRNSVAFGAREDVRSFFAAPDATRKQILEQILGVGLYAEGERVARKRQADALKELDPLLRANEKLVAAHEQQVHTLELLQTSSSIDDLTLAAKLAQAQAKAKAGVVASRTVALADAETALKAAQDAADGDLSAWKTARDTYLKGRTLAERALRTASQAVGAAQARVSQADGQKTKLAKAGPSMCPTCEQVVNAEQAKQFAASIAAELTVATEALKQAESDKKKYTTTLAALVEPIQPTFPEVDAARTVYNEARLARTTAVSDHRQAESDAEAAVAKLEATQSGLKQAAVEVDRLATEIENGRTTIEEKRRDLERLTFVVEAFGNGGLKSFLIESEIGAINKAASKYALRLLGPGASVRMQATTTLKTVDAVREKLSIDAVIPGCTGSYAGASKGQKRRLDLALLLAFRDIVSERSHNAFRQFFADELFDGVDRTGVEFVVELLREISNDDCPVVLVTHNPHLKAAVDRIITVTHEREFYATISVPGGATKKKKAVATAK